MHSSSSEGFKKNKLITFLAKKKKGKRRQDSLDKIHMDNSYLWFMLNWRLTGNVKIFAFKFFSRISTMTPTWKYFFNILLALIFQRNGKYQITKVIIFPRNLLISMKSQWKADRFLKQPCLCVRFLPSILPACPLGWPLATHLAGWQRLNSLKTWDPSGNLVQDSWASSG